MGWRLDDGIFIGSEPALSRNARRRAGARARKHAELQEAASERAAKGLAGGYDPTVARAWRATNDLEFATGTEGRYADFRTKVRNSTDNHNLVDDRA
jgi:hypothetical protein